MSFLIVLACSLAFVLLCKAALRRLPGAFYVLALVLSVLYAATSYVTFPLDFKLVLFLLIQKGTLSAALFVIVMYMGIFRDVGFVKHRLMPVRAALSIIACILCLGHVVKYALAFAPTLGLLPGVTLAGLVIGAAAFVLMAVLGVTSFQDVKRAMAKSAWAALQKWAYLFYGLVYVHLACLLAPSAVGAADGSAAGRLAVYSVVFGLYAVLRVGKALLDGRRRARGAAGVVPADEAQAEGA